MTRYAPTRSPPRISNLYEAANDRTSLNPAGGDVSTVDFLWNEVDPGYHEVSPAYKAGLVCAVRLDGEYPLHRDEVLAIEAHKQQALVLLELLQLNADSYLPHGNKGGVRDKFSM